MDSSSPEFLLCSLLSSEPEASPEESPPANEEAAASSAAASEPEEADAPGKLKATENGEKTDDAAGEEKGEAAEKKE